MSSDRKSGYDMSNQSIEASARPFGANQMHVRTGSSKLNPMLIQKDEQSHRTSLDVAGAAASTSN